MKNLKINIPESLMIAYDILIELDKNLTENEAKALDVNVFSNCREQGFVVNN